MRWFPVGLEIDLPTIKSPSLQVNAALTRVDNTIESLFGGLKERGVENCVNVIIVSDHGMATYDPNKLVHLKEVKPYQR